MLPVVPDGLRRPSFFGRGSTQAWQWADEEQDPRLGLVRFLRDVGLEFASMRELLEIAGPTTQPAELPPGYHHLLAHAYLDMGLREPAVDAINQAMAQREQVTFPITSGQTLVDAWLRLAKLDDQRGDSARALYTLDLLDSEFDGALSKSQRLLWLDIKSRVLLGQRDFAAAAKVLAKANDLLDGASPDLYLPYLQRLYIRYNYALALIQNSQLAKGLTLLERIGTVADPSPAERAVRDQANLTMAYYLLRAGQGASAKAAFQRLPLTGSYTNNALIGLGWTELAPQGKALNKVSPGTFGSFLALGSFEQAPLPKQEPEQLRRALVSWQELATRNPDDAAVQEALVVVPFALEKLGKREQAGEAYDNAITKLTQSQRKIKQDIETLRQGLQTRALLFQYAASGLPHTRWTDDVRTSNPIEEHLQNFRDLQRLQGALQDNPTPQTPMLLRAMAYAAEAEMRDAQNEIAANLQVQLERIERYHTLALTGLTRYYQWDFQRNQNDPGPASPKPAENRAGLQ